jgi:hypothetical protein
VGESSLLKEGEDMDGAVLPRDDSLPLEEGKAMDGALLPQDESLPLGMAVLPQ